MISKESRMFAQKIARSIVEIQPNINNTVDIAVLIECLGYRLKTLTQFGFADYHALANYIFNFLDMYEMREKSKELFIKSFSAETPKISKRMEEAIGLLFPWLGSIALLFLTGVSLWMALGFPIQITTAFVTGVFLGVIVTEGTLQVFNRLVLYYYEQTNMCEVKRLMKRSYSMMGVVLLVTTGALFVLGYIEKISFHLLSLTIISMVTVSLHRTSYMIIYALKRVRTLIVAYSFAFAALLSTYYFGQLIIPSGITRYFVGLILAFIALSIFSIDQHRKLVKGFAKPFNIKKPHFYKPLSVNDETIKSRFSIQLWETIPYSFYGMFYLITMFSDRILSWIYNPIVLKGNFGLPMAFNAPYHIGADMALVVLLPASIIQYIIMMPIHIRINNISIRTTISQNSVNVFIQATYRRVMIVSMIVAVATAGVLNLVAPPLMMHAGITQISIRILQIASVANIFMCIFTANSLFLAWFNKTKFLLIVVVISSIIIITYGISSDHTKLENLTFGYFAASVFAAITSVIYTHKVIKRAATVVFSKLV